MQIDLTGKKAIVTGSSNGIGLAIALAWPGRAQAWYWWGASRAESTRRWQA